MVFKSGYVVYRNQNANDKQQQSKANQVVSQANGGEQQADSLEKEYEEKIRKANMEMRREHGDQMDVDQMQGEGGD